MKNQFNWLPVAAIFVLALTSSTFAAQAKVDDLRAYVWPFSTNDSSMINLVTKLTEEFETALTHVKGIAVLERRRYSRLLDHRDSEKEIMELNDLPQAVFSQLKSLKASTVIFGDVDDDSVSGHIKVTVVFQNLDGKKKQWSIRFSRGKQYDAESRETAMQRLVNKIVDSNSAELINPQPEDAKKSGWKKIFLMGTAAAFALGTIYIVNRDNSDKTLPDSPGFSGR